LTLVQIYIHCLRRRHISLITSDEIDLRELGFVLFDIREDLCPTLYVADSVCDRRFRSKLMFLGPSCRRVVCGVLDDGDSVGD
jgi:hypothetical protein